MTKITKSEIAAMAAASNESTALAAPSKHLISAEDFLRAEGRSFGGSNILELAVGQAVTDIEIVEQRVLVVKDLNSPKKDAKKKIKAWTGKCDGMELALPIATSFLAAAEKAELKPGDRIAILRRPDYTSSHGRDHCEAYTIKILA